jgi:hypothetical protein
MSRMSNHIYVRVFLAILFTLSLAHSAFSQADTGNPENWCRNGAFPSDSAFQSASIKAGPAERVHFYSDEDDCPKEQTAKCVARAYLVNGDQVIVSRVYGSWRCSWYQPAKGSETVGWIPAANLQLNHEPSETDLESWIGTWKYYDDTIVIKHKAGSRALDVNGDAIWHGLNNNVHTGETSGSASPQGNRLEITDDICKVRLIMVGGRIVASDNSDCGGANVRFDGVYTRSKR